ncbi:MAG: hypothetical protein HND39_05730 [Ignavibacteriota bacterium]|nr:MAG: hypothetical protein EDM72_04240 [Chlorobiota bacterium]MBE7475762.1 hypothetical protein [Ignavibacteriales bacterium]MBL1122933.1 hypothetical protein [Ignavibacteriota bacterium]MCC7094017.1 hypothetical protein [Ignavibacteriaceae bacterium]MCE7857246.1 hypothetical protein [Ignavibacteria bacterium CHB3]MEB2297566.1 hypothetical protein [Ignavibacteria bacterium]
MKSVLYFSVLMTVLFLFSFEQISAQEEDLYKEGTVWSLTFVRTSANKSEDYLKGLANTWVANMDEAKKEGLILSYKILQGNPANEDDFDLLLMIENKNLAAFDPDEQRDAKFDAIEKKIRDKMGDDYEMTITNYDDIRTLLGTKLMREISLKK